MHKIDAPTQDNTHQCMHKNNAPQDNTLITTTGPQLHVSQRKMHVPSTITSQHPIHIRCSHHPNQANNSSIGPHHTTQELTLTHDKYANEVTKSKQNK